MPRFAIAVKSCHKYAARRQAMMESWLPFISWADWFFVIGNCPPNQRPSVMGEDPRILLCDVPDDWGNMAPKVRCACRHALDSNVDHLFICDDDTFVDPQRLAEASRRLRDYVGFMRTWGLDYNGNIPYAQGSAYWLSARSMEIVIKAGDVMRPGIIDDGAVGQALDGKVALTHDRRYWPGPNLEFVPAPNNNLISTHKAQPDQMKQLGARVLHVGVS